MKAQGKPGQIGGKSAAYHDQRGTTRTKEGQVKGRERPITEQDEQGEAREGGEESNNKTKQPGREEGPQPSKIFIFDLQSVDSQRTSSIMLAHYINLIQSLHIVINPFQLFSS